jgi:hypothetical protein
MPKENHYSIHADDVKKILNYLGDRPLKDIMALGFIKFLTPFKDDLEPDDDNCEEENKRELRD